MAKKKVFKRKDYAVIFTLGILFLFCLTVIIIISTLQQRKQFSTLADQTTASTIVINHTNTDVSTLTQAQLDAARKLDILFNHQSVGNNILSGIDSLAGQNSTRYAMTRSSNPAASWYAANTGMGDFMEGSNGDPASKVNGFNNLLRNGYAAHINVAFMKFCFVDFGSGQAAWDLYRPMMEALIRDYPNVTFVWWTAPLETSSGNQERAVFNNLVRQYVSTNGGYLFDIADIESHDDSGNAIKDSSGSESLYTGYASDTGHLNETGSVKAASALWNLLVKITSSPVNPSMTVLPTGISPTLYCLGGQPCTTNVPTQMPSITAVPSEPLITSEVTPDPSLTGTAISPVPTIDPCQNGTNSLSSSNKHHKSSQSNNGFFQMFFALFYQFLQQLLALLGIQIPDSGNTPC